MRDTGLPGRLRIYAVDKAGNAQGAGIDGRAVAFRRPVPLAA